MRLRFSQTASARRQISSDRLIVDSGSNAHLFASLDFFPHGITRYALNVGVADARATLTLDGYGPARIEFLDLSTDPPAWQFLDLPEAWFSPHGNNLISSETLIRDQLFDDFSSRRLTWPHQSGSPIIQLH